MASDYSNPRESRLTRTSLTVLGPYPSAINRDSKAQHLLGLSRTELDHARSESSTSKRASTISSITSSNRSSIRNLLSWKREKSATSQVIPTGFGLQSKASLLDGFGGETDAVTLSQTTSLSKYPSTSTLRSSYETPTTPLRISQQTPNSSNYDFNSQTDLALASYAAEQEMDCTQRRFFKSPKLKGIDEARHIDHDAMYVASRPVFSNDSRRSSFSICPKVKSHFVTKVSVHPSPPRPNTPSIIYQNEKASLSQERPRATLRKKKPIEPKVIETRIATSTWTPYVKIHVRKPKAGTKDWFDDLEGVSSDGEDHDPDAKHFSDVELADKIEHGRVRFSPPTTHRRKFSRDRKSMQVTINEEPELLVKPISPIYGSTSPRNRSLKSSMKSLSDLVPKHDSFIQADLSQHSVLNLSTSEDEDDEDEEIYPPPKPIQPRLASRQIRQSVADGMDEDSDVEVGFAHTVKTTGRPQNKRPTPIRIFSNPETSVWAPSPMTASPWQLAPKHGSWNSASNASDGSDTREAEEDILLRSFPATPTDANRPRSSISLSDEGRIMSMRMMKVTRQEENLIAAMRIKRAAMKRVERAAARGSMSRTQDEGLPVPTRRSSLGDTPRSSVDVNRPVTAFVPDSHGRGSSEIPLLVEFQDKTPLRDSSSYPRRKSSTASYASYGPFPRLQSGFASGSSGDSRTRDSNLIVLDNLNSELPRRIFPSQLYMESPFATWEKKEMPRKR